MGEIHELFVLALSLVWFAGATPDQRNSNFEGALPFGAFLLGSSKFDPREVLQRGSGLSLLIQVLPTSDPSPEVEVLEMASAKMASAIMSVSTMCGRY